MTLMPGRGIPITEVSRWLGHRSIEGTNQIRRLVISRDLARSLSGCPRRRRLCRLRRLGLAAAAVQDRLGVAAGLGGALEDEVAGRRERDARVVVRAHR